MSDSKRLRKLTFKAMERYDDRVKRFDKDFEEIVRAIHEITDQDPQVNTQQIVKDIAEACDKLDNIYKSYIEFLEQTNTAESNAKHKETSVLYQSTIRKVTSFRDTLTSIQRPQVERPSSMVSRSAKSEKSVETVKAKAAAALARLEFLEMEAKLKREKADLDEREKIAAAEMVRQKKNLDIELELIKERKLVAEIKAESDAYSDCLDNENVHIATQERKSPPLTQPVEKDFDQLTRYLLRKDLSLSRLVNFDDRPENYQSWKNTFSNVCSEMNLTASEEIDLLVKWLGSSSRKTAISIRATHSHNPRLGLDKLWVRLDEQYGTFENVKKSLLSKLENFKKILPKDMAKLYDLSDILSEVEGLKSNPKLGPAMSYFDSSFGVQPIVAKLPTFLQDKWVTVASSYKETHDVTYPPFSEFSNFVRRQAKIRNDPSFQMQQVNEPQPMQTRKVQVNANKTAVENVTSSSSCILHNTDKHKLNDCRTFKSKSFNDKRKLLKDNALCFKCFCRDHTSKDCTKNIVCSECGKPHNTAMHITTAHGGEQATGHINSETVESRCTQICGVPGFSGKSCAKIVLIDTYCKDNQEQKIRTYAIVDDQSNRSLISPDLLNSLNLQNELVEYSVNSCSGVVVTSGRKARGLVIESLDRDTVYELLSVLECEFIPNNQEEIPTPEVASHYSHLYDICNEIPQLDHNAGIHLIIGRDLIDAHVVIDQRVGPRHTPYAQKLSLGWVIIGETCLGNPANIDDLIVTVNKTCIVSEGRSSVLSPCTNSFCVSENCRTLVDDDIFVRTKDDEKLGPSIEDREFISLMDSTFKKDQSGNWSAPLPFKQDRSRLPNNRVMALRRAELLQASLSKNPKKAEHFIAFMDKIFTNGHAEVAPDLHEDDECWYLPIFGVYHAKKVDQIRVVFDSSAKYQDVSLNDVLLSGPDLTNSLLGVLLRFRNDAIAITADIQQMFYGFLVDESCRDFLRFFWYRDNNPNNKMIEYRMRVHVFGNRPSPAVAAYGLRKTAETSAEEFGHDVANFILNDFYVDDGLTSVPSDDCAINLIKQTQLALSKNGNLRLHKVASNSSKVLESLPRDDLAKDLVDLDFSQSEIPLQRSLGMYWDIKSDVFKFIVSEDVKPFTRRGVLSTVNSIYDPIGFVAPVVVAGKLILRDLLSDSLDWDDPLPQHKLVQWQDWCTSLRGLNELEIPRQYLPGVDKTTNKELHVYCDASEKVIAASAYIVSVDGASSSFVLGKAKVAPPGGHTIPRLELCATVLATEISSLVISHLDIQFDQIKYYSDSKVVLGYISNRTRRFYTYVSNRVQKILRHSTPQQWNYISTNSNPADVGTRGVDAYNLKKSLWLKGPNLSLTSCEQPTDFPLIDPELDQEIRVNVLTTTVDQKTTFGSERFSKFSEWLCLKRAIACLQHIAASFHKGECKGWHIGCNSIDSLQKAEVFIIRTVQEESYPEEFAALKVGKPIPKDSSVVSLNSFLDHDGVLRVGGRIRNSDFPIHEKNPIILPKQCHIATLIVRHFHAEVKHQGRQFTEGALRLNGYWIVGAKRLVSSIIYNCVKCRKLRGKYSEQIMADLPKDRVQPAPPFTYVGVDTFGPWSIVTRKTRGGQANSKRWAILFTCLTIRAIHIEVVEELSSSAFTNALRRFISRFGNVKIFRSDRGTNFVGTVNELKIDSVNVEDGPVDSLLKNKGVVWIFNPPHAPHMGGIWERLIGVVKRILNSILCDIGQRNLTHDVLVTVMAEICSIVNSRPIVPVSTDSSVPEILSPSTILTQKFDFSTQDFEHLSLRDIYRSEWKCVQVIANMFWKRWRTEYLQQLQPRQKWKHEHTNICEGDVVLVKDDDVSRNHWPYGIVEKVMPSSDGKIRKVCVRLCRDGKTITYTRPISELVLLVRQSKVNN